MYLFINCLISYLINLFFFFGLGFFVIVVFIINNVLSGYFINYFGFIFGLDGYIFNMSIGK